MILMIDILKCLFIILALFSTALRLGLVSDFFVDIWYECFVVFVSDFGRGISCGALFFSIHVGKFISFIFHLIGLNNRLNNLLILVVPKYESFSEILRGGPHQFIHIFINYLTFSLVKAELLIAQRCILAVYIFSLTFLHRL